MEKLQKIAFEVMTKLDGTRYLTPVWCTDTRYLADQGFEDDYAYVMERHIEHYIVRKH